MALREIRILGDDLLRKKSREVEIVDDRVKELIKDMIETMIKFEGVGIAAPQIGILKRIVIVMDGDKIIPLINPKIVPTGQIVLQYVRPPIQAIIPTTRRVTVAIITNGTEIKDSTL